MASTINEKFSALREAHPEVLARHWTEAGEVEPAIAQWSRAGKAARARNAFSEALEHYRQALAILGALPQSAERDAREVELMRPLVRVLQIARGYSARETIEAAARFASLAQRSGTIEKLVMWVGQSCGAAVASGDLAAACALADQALDLALREGNHANIGGAYALQIVSQYWSGDPAGVERCFAAGLPFFEDAKFGEYPGNVGLAFGVTGWNAWTLGRSDTARERVALAMALARGFEEPLRFGILTAYCFTTASLSQRTAAGGDSRGASRRDV